MRPIFSATDSYNFKLAKWLEEKLKPLSVNDYTINDVFCFAEEIRDIHIEEDEILASYDVTSLFSNVPLKETIDILVEKSFSDDWFNRTYKLNLQKNQLASLLEIATTNQLFQFNGRLYEQRDGVAMGSLLGPLMANVFMCYLEEKLVSDGLLPTFYRRYVDDTLVIMPSVITAENFLTTLNNLYPSLSFTMELARNDRISFIGMEILKKGSRLKTEVYRKPTNTGLLLHFHSHVDKRYKECLNNTMVHRAKALSSTPQGLEQECEKLRTIFNL